MNCSEFYVRNKTEQSFNANEKSLAEFYIELTLAMHFKILCEHSALTRFCFEFFNFINNQNYEYLVSHPISLFIS